ncbi:WXG100 family type VII secretion target [Kitasatospora sp. NPDC085879]|uniref:WXG100 family type VII secretion target n=1 Tax=Kitasatospora sp. NPDC085879 TaxID=3154769 RepID=UPI00342F98E0
MPANFNFVDTDAMRAAVGRFQETESGLQNILRNVHSQLDALTGSWTGDPAMMYQQLMAEWTNQFNRINTDLRDMVDILKANIREYERAHASNAEAVGTMRTFFSV